MQGVEHPHPGVRYSGTNRTAYLPDSPEGTWIGGCVGRIGFGDV